MSNISNSTYRLVFKRYENAGRAKYIVNLEESYGNRYSQSWRRRKTKSSITNLNTNKDKVLKARFRFEQKSGRYYYSKPDSYVENNIDSEKFDSHYIVGLISIPGNRLSFWRTYWNKLEKVHDNMYEEGKNLGSAFTIANELG